MMSLTEQRNRLQKYVDEKYMPFIFNELHATDDQIDSEKRVEDSFLFKVVFGEEHGFYKRWYEAEGFDIRADTILSLLKEFKEYALNSRRDWFSPYTVSNTVNTWVYSRGMKQWWKQIKDKLRQLPPNETEHTCPVCLRDYNRQTLLKDGIQNSDFNSRCNHWCCMDCWAKIYYQHNEIDTCPICRADITEWLKSYYQPDSDSEDDA
jgi:hypothetical protein